jgi:hypothetical protein
VDGARRERVGRRVREDFDAKPIHAPPGLASKGPVSIVASPLSRFHASTSLACCACLTDQGHKLRLSPTLSNSLQLVLVSLSARPIAPWHRHLRVMRQRDPSLLASLRCASCSGCCYANASPDRHMIGWSRPPARLRVHSRTLEPVCKLSCRVAGLKFQVSGFGSRGSYARTRAARAGRRQRTGQASHAAPASSLGFRVSGLGSQVSGLGLRLKRISRLISFCDYTLLGISHALHTRVQRTSG